MATTSTTTTNTATPSAYQSIAFYPFTSGDVIVSSDLVSTPVWTGDRGILYGPANIENNQMVTSSTQKLGLSGEYYLDVYNTTSSLISSSNVQFSIAYADLAGSGSNDFNVAVDGYSPSRTNYGQYRNLLLGDDSDFIFNSGSSEYFYAISIDRARFKESLMPGSLRLTLSSSLAEATLIDDSLAMEASIVGSTKYYNIISSGSSDSISYGWFLPDLGLILLDGESLADADLVTTNRFAATGTGDPLTNAAALYSSIRSFAVRSAETVSSNYFFVRAKNAQFNYSTNPTFRDNSGNILSSMVYFPETFITTVGLYNDNRELLAVAKLSKPLPKNFNKEALIRIKLDF